MGFHDVRGLIIGIPHFREFSNTPLGGTVLAKQDALPFRVGIKPGAVASVRRPGRALFLGNERFVTFL